MGMNSTHEIKLQTGQEHWLQCRICETMTCHHVTTAVYEHTHDGCGSEWWYEYEIVQCQGCHWFSFRSYWHSTETDVIEEQDNIGKREEVFPKRRWRYREMDGAHQLPDTVRRLYDETYTAIVNELEVLAGVGIRAIVESVCRDKSATGKNLEQKIDSLVKLGFLTQSNAEFLHSTRLLGNKSAHDAMPLEPRQLEIALKVIEHLLQSIYIIPKESVLLPKRKKN